MKAIIFVFMCLLVIFLCMIFKSCTYNVSMAHTEGKAVDVIDETSSTTPTISTQVNVPKEL